MRLLYRSSPPPAPDASSSDESADSASASSEPGSPVSSSYQAASAVSAAPGLRQARQHTTHSALQAAAASSTVPHEGQRPAAAQAVAASSPPAPVQSSAMAAQAMPGVLPGASYAAMQAAWLGTASALPHMSLTRLIAMFFLERSIAGLSSAGQQLLWLGAFLLPLSSASPYAFMSIVPHVAMPDAWLVSRQPQETSSRPSPAVSEQIADDASTTLQDAPPLVAGQNLAGQQAEAWQEAASLVQVSLALGLQVGSPEKRQLARGTPQGRLKQEEEAAPALAHSSMASTISSFCNDSPSLSRSASLSTSGSSEVSLSNSELDMYQPSHEYSSDSNASMLQQESEVRQSDACISEVLQAGPLDSEGSPVSLQQPETDGLHPAQQAASLSRQSNGISDTQASSAAKSRKLDAESAQMPACDISNASSAEDQADAADAPLEQMGSTNAAVPASSLEAWPGKGYFAIGKTLYLMPRAAEPQPDFSSVHAADEGAANAGKISCWLLKHQTQKHALGSMRLAFASLQAEAFGWQSHCRWVFSCCIFEGLFGRSHTHELQSYIVQRHTWPQYPYDILLGSSEKATQQKLWRCRPCQEVSVNVKMLLVALCHRHSSRSRTLGPRSTAFMTTAVG